MGIRSDEDTCCKDGILIKVEDKGGNPAIGMLAGHMEACCQVKIIALLLEISKHAEDRDCIVLASTATGWDRKIVNKGGLDKYKGNIG